MFLGTWTLKPDRVATLSSLLPPARCQEWVLFPPSPPRSASVTQLWSPPRGPPFRRMESFRESVSSRGWRYLGASAGLDGVERPAEPASSAPPMSLTSLLPKAVNLESAEVPNRDPRPPNTRSGPDCLSVPSKLQHGFIPKQNNKSRPPACPGLTSVTHHDRSPGKERSEPCDRQKSGRKYSSPPCPGPGTVKIVSSHNC